MSNQTQGVARQAELVCSIEQTGPVWKYRVWDYDGDGYFRLERASLRGGVWREDRYDCEVYPMFPHLWCDTPEQAIDEYRKRRQQDVAKLQAEIETEIGRLTKQAEDM